MKNKFWHIFILITLLVVGKSDAQDLHFSQYFANPISFNPANTGFFDGSYRLGANHKQQWPWAIDSKFLNYNTSSAYADFSMLDKKINKTDWMGIGFNFLNDMTGDGNLTANKAYMSMAYHKGLDKDHKHFLSVGATLGYVHRSVNFGAFYFDNQWVDLVGFDVSLPNNESYTAQKTGYVDLGAGIQGKNQIGEKVNIVYGLSFLHLNKPKESFYDQSNRLGIRYLWQSGVEYKVNNRLDLQASFYYTYQKKAQELLMGALAGISTHNNPKEKASKIYIGTFYRLKDALAPIVGYQYHRTRLLINYDVNLSSLSKASRGNGGFEISLVQIGTYKRKKSYTYKTYCPKF